MTAHYDFIAIGSGPAGKRAAIQAAKNSGSRKAAKHAKKKMGEV